jgi:TolB-like protein/class 3 adenylate cyclase
LESAALATERVERKLAAILAADVAGYSRFMGADEEGTLGRLKAHRRELIDPKIAEHRGRIFKTTGDGLLVEFASVVDAVRCAGEIQKAMREREGSLPADQRIEIRVGINLGDVIIDEDDVYGDGVNVAARLEALADPGGVVISSAVFEQVRDRVPESFEDLGDRQVKNIARPVRVYRLAQLPTAASLMAMSPLPLPDKPSIAVLPFANMSGDPEQEYFADGMVEEIITALSRIRWLFVIARNSSFTYKGQAIDVKRVGRELGVRYILEGSVRKGGGRVRISVQLIEAETGAHLWADRFDGSLEDIFDLQDNVASNVAGVLEPALQAAETARSANRPTRDLTAYDLYLRAGEMMRSGSEQVAKALDLLKQAIARDPRYGPALARAGVCCLRLLVEDRSNEPEADRRKGADFARRALEVAGDDPVVLSSAAMTLGTLGEDIGAMIMLTDRALALNPNYASGWHQSGNLRLWAGYPEIAIEHLEIAQRLSPRMQLGHWRSLIGVAHFLSRRFDQAVSNLILAIQQDQGDPVPYRYLAASYAHMGRPNDAQEIVARLRAITPRVIPGDPLLRNPEHRELFLSGLRLAAETE